MKITAARLEGILLVLLGSFMALLLLSDNYWLFLNPKFTWLTAGAAATLMPVGIIATLHPRQQSNPFGVLIFSVFLALAAWSTSWELQSRPMDSPARIVRPEPEEARSLLNGLEYIRINTAELFSLCEKRNGEAVEERFVIRGYILYTTDAEPLDRLIVARTVVVCCLADAVAVGFRIQGDSHARISPESLEAGRWVQLFGRLQVLPPVRNDVELRVIQGIPVLVHPRYAFIVENIRETADPIPPFIFEFRNEEPYAY